MPDATHTTLREQVKVIIADLIDMDDANHLGEGHDYDVVAHAVLAVFAERERVLREQIEALDWTDGVHTAAAAGFHAAIIEVLAVFDA